MDELIERMFQHRALTVMGHDQRIADRNAGLGWIYYALGRILRPALAVVIGSYRGFVPLMLGKALSDNLEGGSVVLIEPSMVDDFWKEPATVRHWFEGFGVGNVRHFSMTTQDFVQSEAFSALGPIGILFVDGYHSLQQARFDYEAFRGKLGAQSIVLFHDSARVRTSDIYGKDRVFEHRVKDLMDDLKRDPQLQVLDLPYGDGVTLVRRATVA